MGRSIIGTIVSDKADKTIVLSVVTRKTHPLYKKQYSRTTRYIAHDEKNEGKVGDTVEVTETRPISKRKHLTLHTIIERSEITEADRVESVTAKTDEEIDKLSEKDHKPNTKVVAGKTDDADVKESEQ